MEKLKSLFFSSFSYFKANLSKFAYELESATSPEFGTYLHSSPCAMIDPDSYGLET